MGGRAARKRLSSNLCHCILASLLLIPGLFQNAASQSAELKSADSKSTYSLSMADYQDKVYASWLGQMVGNFYGLPYEFKFIEQPGPENFPYGYGSSLERLKEFNGAFSDDDTDIEYMYLLAMEKYGTTPYYQQLAEDWQHQVRERVWAANRQALALMRADFSPPLTGHKYYNSEWFQIDPQLINEIWAVTAPGMIDYAVQKTDWAARITNDSFGVEPAMHYAAMYSAAFYESDINTLINIGLKALPKDGKFSHVVIDMQKLYQKYPQNWQQARQEMAAKYAGNFEYNPNSWYAIDATLNGACAILALLYGQGDFQRTMDMSVAMGFDADNQAATLGGLLGIIGGVQAIPESLLYPFGNKQWQKPFNDKYINITREDLPDASIEDMARRIATQGEKVIIANGGSKETVDGQQVYRINREASFVAPMELAKAPPLFIEVNQQFEFEFYPLLHHQSLDYVRFSIVEGSLPEGVTLKDNRIFGVSGKTGIFQVTIQGVTPGMTNRQTYTLSIHSKNLAPEAEAVIHNDKEYQQLDDEIFLIRDGKRGLRDGLSQGDTFYSAPQAKAPASADTYGYRFKTAQEISTLLFNPGYVKEDSGWFTSIHVQYLDNQQEWQDVKALNITPRLELHNNKYLQGKVIDHLVRFQPVSTTAIRIQGIPGGTQPDDPEQHKVFQSAISELSVHQY
ncbi:ADP-ribosylglycohydrolase family protein [Thalassotalea litorea]|uniref:ADP-ribosylglycohydrolase family protein n=1 Tax=Thalassotalea litorea TaxID=2020715 RepID=A0A5R9IUJ5_9GAMM|nr:ADP-ribosylglycohydrolase family protein [Thalassotalea litorea]TLU66846.1 ADP-ribosylglycohydrolase family protein [Thalassotalea litorea]